VLRKALELKLPAIALVYLSTVRDRTPDVVAVLRRAEAALP